MKASGIVVEMLKDSDKTGIDLVVELAKSIMSEDVDWEVSCIVNSYRGRKMLWNKGFIGLESVKTATESG